MLTVADSAVPYCHSKGGTDPFFVKSESDTTVRQSIVTPTWNLCSAINPSKVHTHSSEHTPGAVAPQLWY